MCGLFGRYRFDGGPVDLDESLRMLELVAHRGPDDIGYYRDGRVFLGHRRLSIIDVEGGKQPLSSEDGRLVFIGNGEIYNYREIRDWLLAKGHTFKTRSDSEVILHLFEEVRERCVERLNGMFAFALYERDTGTLFLARDRLGIKPMYYYRDDGQFVFCSEMKGIIKSGLVPLVPNDKVIYQFLMLHHSIPPDTLVEGVQSLKPGHYLLVGDRCGEQVPYWDIESNRDREPLADEAAMERVEELLAESVEMELMSDVPLGLFLSGGIDSSLVAVLMRRHAGSGIKTFSIGFGEKEYSELPYARRVSDMISSDHMEIVVGPRDIVDNIETVVWARETPISEVSDIPIYLLCRAASREVKVVLTGEGGDEAFCGYAKYAYEKWAPRFALFSHPAVRALYRNRVADALIPSRVGRALDVLSTRDTYRRLYRWFSFFYDDEMRKIVPSGREHLLDTRSAYAELASGKSFRHPLDEMQYLDFKAWLPDNLLLRGDRLSMACGLEARVPYLDHRIIELSFLLPSEMKVRGTTCKYVTKRIAEAHFDRKFIYRKKIGFEVPVGIWFRNELKDFLVSHLTKRNSFIGDYIDRAYVERLLSDHLSARKDNYKKLWILLNMELWRDRFLAA